MKDYPKPKVGQEFYLVKFESRSQAEGYQAIVSKVGVKYFTVIYKTEYSGRTNSYEVEFVIKTREVNTEYNTPYRLWGSKSEYEDYTLTTQLFKELKSNLNCHSMPKWATLGKLKAIHTIIQEGEYSNVS